MKHIISLLLFPVFVSFILSGLLTAFFRCCSRMELASEYSFSGHLLKACLYIAIATGLPLAIFSAVAAVFLAIASFVFKNWARAIISIGITTGSLFLWNYLLNVPYPN